MCVCRLCTQSQIDRQSKAYIWPNNCNDICGMLDLLQIHHFGSVFVCVCARCCFHVVGRIAFPGQCTMSMSNFSNQRNHVSHAWQQQKFHSIVLASGRSETGVDFWRQYSLFSNCLIRKCAYVAYWLIEEEHKKSSGAYEFRNGCAEQFSPTFFPNFPHIRNVYRNNWYRLTSDFFQWIRSLVKKLSMACVICDQNKLLSSGTSHEIE